MAAFNDAQVAEIRRIVRLEALRSAVLSVASESLDDSITSMVVSVDLDETGTLGATISFSDRTGHVVTGGSL